MRRVIMFSLVVVFALCGVAFALGDNEQDQEQSQVGINRNSNEIDSRNTNVNDVNSRNTNVNDVNNRNTNRNLNEQDQGQIQGQLQGQLQGQGQGQFAVGKVDVQDNSSYESKAYSFSPPGLSSNKGMNEGNIYSIFGGIGLSEDSEYVVCIEKLSTIERLEKLGYISHDEAVVEARAALMQLKDSTKPKRILSFGPKTRGRHLFNLFGLIASDSFVDEGKVNARILKKESGVTPAVEKVVSVEMVGNKGNLPGGIQN